MTPSPRPTRRTGPAATAASAALLLGLAGCTASSSPAASGSASATSSSSSSASPSTGDPGSAASSLEEQYRSVIRQVLPSVVEIRTDQGLGSGVIFDGDGNIVTNAHVVGSATSFQVLTAGSAMPLDATLVGIFPEDDLAVIKVSDPQGLKPATFADSTDVQLGTIVLAMGNPLGLASSVSNGIVSATGRTLTEPSTPELPGATLPNSIQTSADINPGNSGGALVNLQGEVIGIPTLTATTGSSGGAAPGIGFAIPSDTVNRIAPQLIADGNVTDSGRAALDVAVTTVADQSGQPVGAGIVQVTPGGAAETAGLQRGDLITSVDGQPISSVQQLSTVLASLQDGKDVPVVVQRGGQEQSVQVSLGQLGSSG